MALLPTLSSFSPPSFPTYLVCWIFIWSFGSDLVQWKCCWCRVTSGVRHAGLHRGRGQQDGGGGAGGRAHLPRHAHRLLQGELWLVDTASRDLMLTSDWCTRWRGCGWTPRPSWPSTTASSRGTSACLWATASTRSGSCTSPTCRRWTGAGTCARSTPTPCGAGGPT